MYNLENERTTILVADDEECLRNLMQIYLEQCGYEVLTAGSGAEALQISRQFKGPIQVLVTDMRMPGMDGAVLANAFCEARPDSGVIYITAAQWQESRLDPPEALMIYKPFDLSQLSDAVRSLLAAVPAT